MNSFTILGVKASSSSPHGNMDRAWGQELQNDRLAPYSLVKGGASELTVPDSGC